MIRYSDTTYDKAFIFLLIVILFSLLLFYQSRLGADGGSYYIYLPSLFLDHDLDFHNEIKLLNDQPKSLIWTGNISQITSTGKVANFFSIGPALVASPIFGIVFLFKKIFYPGIVSLILPPSYIFAYTFSGSLFALLAIIFIYKWLRNLKIFSNLSIALSLIAVIFGSNFFYYFFINPSMSHIFAFAFISFFIIYWYQTLFRRKYYQWVILGILGGVMAIIRWQEIIFFCLPFFETILLLIKRRINFRKEFKYTVLFLIGAAPFLFLQFLSWKIIFGQWFLIPQSGNFFEPLNPHFLFVVFSARNGLLWWTPIYLLGVLGLLRLLKINRRLGLILLFVFLIQLYINSAIVDWVGGFSFGSRRFVDIAFVFIVGITALFDYLRNQKILKKGVPFVLIAFFGLWTLLLLIQFRIGPIKGENAITLSQLLHQQKTSFQLLLSPYKLVNLIRD